MIKILTSEQIRALDEQTILAEPISSLALMERASEAFVEAFCQRFPDPGKVDVFCGPGNNGGDGLAIARLLHDRGYRVRVFLLEGERTADCATNFERLPGGVAASSTADFTCHPDAIVIDAMYGNGFRPPLREPHAALFDRLRQHAHVIVAVDIPSGVAADGTFDERALAASLTITFEVGKLARYLRPSSAYFGETIVVPIGLHPQSLNSVNADCAELALSDVTPLRRNRPLWAHKGTLGHAALIGGSTGKEGAAILAAAAVLRSGAGKATAILPESGHQSLLSFAPDVMYGGEPDFRQPLESGYDAVGVGPGLGARSQDFVHWVQRLDVPTVLDADALNILAMHGGLNSIPKGAVLTPHPGEFAKLCGRKVSGSAALESLRALCLQYECIVILKDAITAIGTPDGHVAFSNFGTPGLATAGTGDVLCGIITGLLAQGYDAKSAAYLGVALHGVAGRLAAKRYSVEGMTAVHLLHSVPHAWTEFK